MNLSIKEINELIYSLGITAHNGNFCNREVNETLLERLYCELNERIAEEAIDEEVDEPDWFGEPTQSQLDAIQRWLKNGDDYEDWNWDGKTLTIYNCNGGVEEYTFEDLNDVGVFDNIDSHFVSNEEADEDYRVSMMQDEQRYESSVEKDYDNHLAKLKERGYITQAILDYVDKKGAATYTEMDNYYKIITGGSNSFTHILANLRTPYKNRKTQRYLAKEGRPLSNALWVVKVANPSNWVVADY